MQRYMFCLLLGVSCGPFSMMTGFVPGASTVHRPPSTDLLLEDVRVPGLRTSLLPIFVSHVVPFGLQVFPISSHTAASLMLVFLYLRFFFESCPSPSLVKSSSPFPVTDFYHLPVFSGVGRRLGSVELGRQHAALQELFYVAVFRNLSVKIIFRLQNFLYARPIILFI